MATILTKKSDTASAVPGSGDLTNSTGGAELAVNTADKRLFVKDSGGTVRELGTNPSSLTTGTATITTANVTTVDTTNIEVTNIKAKDGTAAATIADSTGKITVAGQMTIDGIEVGQGAGNVATNTAVGKTALNANTTGLRNTAVGDGALEANTTGSGNTSVGADALVTATTASNNTAMGQYALYYTTTGASNTAIGRSALEANTTASNNTAVGYQALYDNSTGAYNTAVGSSALANNTTAQFNCAVGFEALRDNTTGADNTAIGGYQTLIVNTTGSYNTAVGRGALSANTTASNNTAVGYQAGYSNTTGAQNLFLGWKAGYSNTTSINNTFVGAEAGYSTTGGSNTFVGRNSSGEGAGYYITTGTKNTIIGGYNGNQGGLDIRTASNYIVLSDGDGNPRQVIDNNGRTYLSGSISTSFPTFTSKVYLADDNGVSVGVYMLTNTTLAQSRIFFGNPNGIVGSISTSGSSTTFSTSSDYRLKENIAPMTGALDKVAQLKPCTYTWKADGSAGEGFIAHELAEVVPQCVAGEKDAVNEDGSIKPQGIDTSFLVATLTAAIQELNAKVEAQAAEIATLKGQ
jgi:hypothetical protein